MAGRRIVALVTVWLAWATARADRVDDLSRQLTDDPDYKVRLSAALNLGRLGDRRAVDPLTTALGDADKTVRGVAAATLGRLVDASVAETVRARVAGALEVLARGDADGFVRSQAEKSAAAIRAIRVAPPAARGVYVEIGPMADASKRGDKSLMQAMRKKVVDSFGQRAPSFATVRPSEADLGRMAAFYVDGTVTALTVQKGPPTSVVCKVSMILATYPQKSMFGFLNGSAEASAAGSSDRAVAEAASDCVTAVVEDLVVSKLVPQIEARRR
ncbi:MAG TPA: HEAT repeat domain-containing protein [Haliangiales bacterium]|nr:HEAT repeat domain-containing protein [Haliangiales bacterium]